MSNFTTPTGRLVFGDAFRPQAVVDDLKKPKIDPVTNQPIVEYVVGVAFAKNDPAWLAFKAEIRAQDRIAWPNYFGPDGNLLPGVKFADKIIDGDGFDKKGQPRNRREGYGGHEIMTFASRFPPTCHVFEGGKWVQITDPNAIKRGYYIKVDGTTTSNQSSQSPGMYRNLGMIAFIGYGAEIVSGPDANERFGNAPPPMPPGASPLPVAPQAPLPGQSQTPPPQAAYAPQPPAYGAPPSTTMSPTSAPQPPAPAYSQYMQQPPPAPPQPVAKVLLPHAQGTYESYIAAGWNDDQLRAQGLMV